MSIKKAYIGATVPLQLKEQMDEAVKAGRFFSLSELIRRGVKQILSQEAKK